MSRARGSLAATFSLAATAAATTWVAMLSWRGFTQESAQFLGPLLVLGTVVAGSGALARWWRVPGPFVVALQIVASGMVLSLILCGSPLPVGSAWQDFLTAFSEAVDSANKYAAPVPRRVPGVQPLLIAGGWVCLLLVDALACTLRRVPLAGLPLLTIYSVPVSLLGGGLSWWIFALTSAGFMAMLFLHENEQVSRWGRPLGEDPAADTSGFGVRTGAVRATAGTIGGVATALAVFVPLLIPTLNVHLFNIGQGPGGDSEITIENPMTDLRRDLVRGEDFPVIRVQTDDPNPEYLRISVLTRFSDNEWSSGDRDVPTNNLADGATPALVGVDESVPRRAFGYAVSVDPSFKSTWLPTQSPISQISASGDWRYDTSTMDFIASTDNLTTAGLDYSMTGVKLDLSAVNMANAPSSTTLVSNDYTAVPEGMPALVRDFANEVTREAPTRFEKAVALQNWFREVGGFTYDLTAATGNGTDELVAFLTDGNGGRTGYCEQFASAMAVMARLLDIPARVAVGFLQPEAVGPNTWEYSSHDLHAWPELFFAGAGWVRFEPTPPGRASGVPDYTTQDVPVVNPTTGPGGSPRPDEGLPSRGGSDSSSPRAAAADSHQGNANSGFPWGLAFGALGGAAVLMALALVPRIIRRARRERGRNGGPEDAWAELRATVLDLRLAWPEGRSPRETQGVLIEQFGTPVDEYTPERPAQGAHLAPDAVFALNRIVRALELLRYSRGQFGGVGSLRAEVATCVAALQGGATRRARRFAEWLPRSVLTRATGTPRKAAPVVVETRYGGVVDHVG